MDRATWVAWACLVAAAGVGGCGSDLDDAVRREIHSQMAAATPPKEAGGVSWRLVRQVYADREERPLWSKHGHPLGRAKDLIASICRAGREGFRPGDYDFPGLGRAVTALKSKEDPEPKDIAALDIRLTAIMLAFGGDVLAGRLDPRAVDDGWYLHSRRASIDSTLRAALEDEGFPDLLESLRPHRKSTGSWSRSWATTASCCGTADGPKYLGARRSSAATGDRGWPRSARGSGPPASSTRPRTRSLYSTTRWPRRWRGSRRGTASWPTAASAQRRSPRSTSPVETPHQPDRAQPRPVSLAARRIRGSLRPGQHPRLSASRPTTADARFSSSG